MEPAVRRFGPFFLNGEAWQISEDPEVRERDLALAQVTVMHPTTGEVRTFAAAQLQRPKVAGLDEIPDEDRYDLRLLVEEMLSLGFNSTAAETIMGLVTRRRMLREPRRP
jgi:hypothetical protein